MFEPRESTVFVATESPPEVGERVRLDLAIADTGPRILLRGKVISRRVGESDPGATIALGGEEREKLNYLNGFVRGGMLNLREKRRLPLRLAVSYAAPGGMRQSTTRDINEEGIFVIATDPLPEETTVAMTITFPQTPSGPGPVLQIKGRVSHTVVVEDEDVPGMGIVFAFSGDEEAQMNSAIDQLERAFFEGTLSDEVLL